MDPWHFITTPTGDPAWNMALDECLWEAIPIDSAPIITRHHFTEESLTLGYAQEPEEREDAGLAHLPWTRRLTGGGAIHHTEATLSFGLIASDFGDGGPKSPGPIACQLGKFISTLWGHLGVTTEVHPTGVSDLQSAPLCADRLYPGDVMHGDVKVAGIGQRHTRGCLLVQAALMFHRAPGAAEKMEQHFPVALAHAISEHFGARVEERAITDEEHTRAKQLAQKRYSNDLWKLNRRGPARATT